MPFDKEGIQPFTEVQILDCVPVVAGVFGIKTGEEWIYVEATQNIQARLLAILRCEKIRYLHILSYNPSHFSFEKILDSNARKSREKHLIYMLDPPCNHIEWRIHLINKADKSQLEATQ